MTSEMTAPAWPSVNLASLFMMHFTSSPELVAVFAAVIWTVPETSPDAEFSLTASFTRMFALDDDIALSALIFVFSVSTSESVTSSPLSDKSATEKYSLKFAVASPEDSMSLLLNVVFPSESV